MDKRSANRQTRGSARKSKARRRQAGARFNAMVAQQYDAAEISAKFNAQQGEVQG